MYSEAFDCDPHRTENISTNPAWFITKHLMKVTLRKKSLPAFMLMEAKTQEPKEWLQSLLLFDKELSPQLDKALMNWET